MSIPSLSLMVRIVSSPASTSLTSRLPLLIMSSFLMDGLQRLTKKLQLTEWSSLLMIIWAKRQAKTKLCSIPILMVRQASSLSLTRPSLSQLIFIALWLEIISVSSERRNNSIKYLFVNLGNSDDSLLHPIILLITDKTCSFHLRNDHPLFGPLLNQIQSRLSFL